MVRVFADTEETIAWKSYLKTVEPPEVSVTLPTGEALLNALRYLEIPEEDIPDVIRQRPSPDSDPELWWYLERAVWSLVAHMGNIEQPPKFAPLRDINDPEYRYFYVHVFVAALPYVQAYLREVGVPEGVAQATLADLGRNVRVHRKREGIGGLGVAWWLMLHFRGVIFQLGRLQFERAFMSDDILSKLRDQGADINQRPIVLSVHIPDFCGPMSPDACDASIDAAKEFFPKYFPEDKVEYAVCNSWLLDPRLKEHLKPESNIIRFQDRFHLSDGAWDSTVGIMQFVFGKTPEHVHEVPQDTSLQRAVAQHIMADGKWYGRGGWLRLDHAAEST